MASIHPLSGRQLQLRGLLAFGQTLVPSVDEISLSRKVEPFEVNGVVDDFGAQLSLEEIDGSAVRVSSSS